MVDVAPLGNFAVAPFDPFRIVEQLQYGLAFVRICAAEPVFRICPDSKQDRIPQTAFADVALNFCALASLRRAETVKAIAEPMVGAIEKDRHRRKLDAGF